MGFTNYELLVTNKHTYTYSPDSTTSNVYEDEYQSGIQDLHARIDLEFIPSASHSLRFGVGAQRHSFLTGAYEEIYQVGETVSDSTVSPDRRTNGDEFHAYIEDDWRLGSKIRLNAGVHASSFVIEGRTYYSVQPRISALWNLSSRTSVKASFAQMQQYIHLLPTTSGLSLPTDLWVPATARIKPQRSWQVAGSIVHILSDGMFELSVEGYYKEMNNLIEYQEGADYFDSVYGGTWEDRVESGRGLAYGGEIFFQKNRDAQLVGLAIPYRRVAGNLMKSIMAAGSRTGMIAATTPLW